MIPKLLALVLVVGAAAAAPPFSLGNHVRVVRDTAAHAMSRRAASAPSVTINGTNYTTYGSCVDGSNALLTGLRERLAASTTATEQTAELNTMLASIDTCPISFASLGCFLLSESCINTAMFLGGDDDTSADSVPTAAEVQARTEEQCSAAGVGCVSYMLSLMAAIGANPTSCSFYYNIAGDAERADSCFTASGSLEGPRLGNNNVSVDGTVCLTCTGGQVVRITDVFYGLRDSAGHPTCASTNADDIIEDDCDGKPACSIRSSQVYMSTVPAARGNPNGATCSGSSADLEVQFTCVAPSVMNMFVDSAYIQAQGDLIDEFTCVKDSSGQYCGAWQQNMVTSGTFGNVSYHGGQLSAEQCQSIRGSGSCCWSSMFDAMSQAAHPSGDTVAMAHERAEFDAAVASCAAHNIPIATVVGSWETQDEHCGTAAAIAAGTGGTASENSVDIDASKTTQTSSGSEVHASSALLLMAVLAVLSM